jgi:hypothetical protein
MPMMPMMPMMTMIPMTPPQSAISHGRQLSAGSSGSGGPPHQSGLPHYRTVSPLRQDLPPPPRREPPPPHYRSARLQLCRPSHRPSGLTARRRTCGSREGRPRHRAGSRLSAWRLCPPSTLSSPGGRTTRSSAAHSGPTTRIPTAASPSAATPGRARGAPRRASCSSSAVSHTHKVGCQSKFCPHIIFILFKYYSQNLCNMICSAKQHVHSVPSSWFQGVRKVIL